MDYAIQHWPILQTLGTNLTNRVQSFMVIGEKGDGVIVATEDGQGFWLGEMEFGWGETKTATEPTPLDIPDLVYMAQGRHHILLLNKRGEIYSMGGNEYEQLGLGTFDREIRFSPHLISSPHKFISVRCGYLHSLALTDDGKVWAWGSNICGQVGVPSSTKSLPSPRQISELDPHRVVAVECGGCHSLALTDQGEVYAWGDNNGGQVGDGSEISTHTPTRILTPTPVQSMAAGDSHTLLLTQTGEVWACGDNRDGELDLSTAIEFTPVLSKVTGLPPIWQIASHPVSYLSIAMSLEQRCFVWGKLPYEKYVSTPRELPPFYSTVESPLSSFSHHRSTPHSVSILETPPSRLSVGLSQMLDNPETSKMDNAKQHWSILHGLGADLANKVREYMVIGRKAEGVIVATEGGLGYWLGEMWFGYGETRTATGPNPLDIPGLVHMAQGNFHILLLNNRGDIYSMGQNYRGQLGLGNQDTHLSPQLISIPHKFTSVRCGHGHSLALTEDGKVWAWGANYCGQVGVSFSINFIPSPYQISELNPHRVIAVECGDSHSLALTDQGEVYGWGKNKDGQLGDNSESSTHTPTRIPIPSPVQNMAAGDSHTLLLTQTGEVYACGKNRDGQLGHSIDTESSPVLSKVKGLPPVLQIASHYATHLSIAMSSKKQCFVWGKLDNVTSISTPRVLSPDYSTVESPLSSFSHHRSTPHSISILETPPSQLSVGLSRMFDNPETSPDVQFVVEQRTIHAHRNILSNSSDYFARMFSESCLAPVDPEDPIVRVTIPDHSYPVFHAFLCFLYTDSFEVYSDQLPQLFELASQYLVPELQQLCISRMRTTLTPATCCLYYPLTHRHSLLPELATFQQELVQFASTRMSEVVHSAAYQSMEPDISKDLTNAVQNFLCSCSKAEVSSVRQRQREIDNAKLHWPILAELDTELANSVESFMVIGEKRKGVIVVTEDGQGFWFKKMKLEWHDWNTTNVLTPLDVPELIHMAQGNKFILLLCKKGKIYSMGENYRGQLGLGNQDTHLSPQLISIPHKFISVRCGGGHSLALTEDGKVWAWGRNDCGQVGVPSSTNFLPSPHQISELDPHRVVAVECGARHSLALTGHGEVYAWGENEYGQLGYEGESSTHSPTRISISTPVKSMAGGNYHTLLLTQTGEVYACGDNGRGQLGLPTTIKSSVNLCKVTGLPPISQIASHHNTELSIAMSSDQQCFVWGRLRYQTSIFTPLKLPPDYSTVESSLDTYTYSYTPHSVSIPETPISRLSAQMSRMFDNPETSDIQFVVEQRTIHAHQIILSNSSDYFDRMFSERWMAQVDPEDPIVRVTIPDHSYQAFHAFLHFFYSGYLNIHLDLLPELFELANQYLVPKLQQLYLSRMRTTITPSTCCLYYPLTHRHSLLPELATFQQELVQFASTRMSEIVDSAAYKSMKPDIRQNLFKVTKLRQRETEMDNAIQYWPILQTLGTNLTNRVQSFIVIGHDGDGVIVATEDGQGFWLGKMQFGSSETKTATEPTLLDIPDLVYMAQSRHHILLLNKRGEIYSMGGNKYGQLGLGTFDREFRFSPHLISTPHKFISVRCGHWHNLALTEDGKVWAWGSNFCGQVGAPSSTESLPSPRQIFKLNPHRVVAVECGNSQSLALTDQGEVYAWGWKVWRQFDDRSKSSTHTPTQILTPSPVKSMAAGLNHTLLLTQTGEVWACGNNEHGQLGLPIDTKFSLCLSKVAGLPPISQIASHPDTHLSIAMSSDKQCFVWGQIADETSNLTLRELPPFYSTVESPLSFYSRHRNTPHSVTIPGWIELKKMDRKLFQLPVSKLTWERRDISDHRQIQKYIQMLGDTSQNRIELVDDSESALIELQTVNDEDEINDSFLSFACCFRFC